MSDIQDIMDMYAEYVHIIFVMNQELQGKEKLEIFKTEAFQTILTAVRTKYTHATKIRTLQAIIAYHSDQLRNI